MWGGRTEIATRLGIAGVYEGGKEKLVEQPIIPVKSHSQKTTPKGQKAIYVVRDGRDACVSYFHYQEGMRTLTDIIRGRTMFGSWSDHCDSFVHRDDILVIHYEDMQENLPAVIREIAEYIDIPPSGEPLTFQECHEQYPWFFRKGKAGGWAEVFTDEEIKLFNRLHGHMLTRLGYPVRGPWPTKGLRLCVNEA
jgi:hypothetical protein